MQGEALELADILTTYEKLIHQLAWKYAKQYGADMEWLVSEAHHDLVTGFPSYDSQKSSPCTWVHRRAGGAMLNSCLRKYRAGNYKPKQNIQDMHHLQARSGFLENLAKEISVEAQHLVNAILTAPSELTSPCKKDFSKLKKWLTKEASWEDRTFQQLWSEVEEALA